jgi:hypothetical protein
VLFSYSEPGTVRWEHSTPADSINQILFVTIADRGHHELLAASARASPSGGIATDVAGFDVQNDQLTAPANTWSSAR